MWKWKNQRCQTQSFEIHNIIRRRTQLLAVIIYIILYRCLYIILFRYKAPGFLLEHPECSTIITENGQKLCVPPCVKLTKWELYANFTLFCMRHNTNSRTVIQITKKCTTLFFFFTYSPTHVALTRRSSLSHWWAKFSGRAKQRKGRKPGPLWWQMGTNSKSDRGRLPIARFTSNTISSHWGSIGRLGDIILML